MSHEIVLQSRSSREGSAKKIADLTLWYLGDRHRVLFATTIRD